MLRIIVVDDEPRQRKGLVEIICRLRPEDEVIAMKDGEQVLEYVHDNEVDIIFSDIRMPQMSGLELSNRLKMKKVGQRRCLKVKKVSMMGNCLIL